MVIYKPDVGDNKKWTKLTSHTGGVEKSWSLVASCTKTNKNKNEREGLYGWLFNLNRKGSHVVNLLSPPDG